jgi:1-acyl-sn-glycerol-3-phosphate acyltransferase
MINLIKIILFFIISTIGILFTYLPIYTLKFFVNILLISIGVKKPIVRDLRKYKHDASIIVFQHNSYLDGYILLAVFEKLTLMMAKKFTKNILFKILAKNLKFLLTDLDKKGGGITKEIERFINKDDSACSYLAMAPTANKATTEDKFGPFSTGAFVAMKPVVPVLIRYNDDNCTWLNDIKNGFRENDDMKRFMKVICMNNIRCEVTILEEVTADGCATPREYADKVQAEMRDYDARVPARF